ncbi:MAG TPA: UDP-N-acetylmuramate--L-alanine ligase, partial [Porphyromonadaceae bacterium]|nr:UDP-N-acetylmuramate--L-alanine ligase [Porphyromonadaceae bacterium]
GKSVAGYDRMETPLTKALVAEGAKVHYEDYVRLVPAEFLDKEKTLVVYTPAVPASHSELQFFR